MTRLVQKGDYWRVTHVEAILAEHPEGTVDIASSSVRDGGVRIKKKVRLDPKSWIVVETPFDVEKATQWFIDHAGEQYDLFGAIATWIPIQWKQKNRWFCNQAVGAATGMKSPEILGPAQFAVSILHNGQDVTQSFFKERS